MTKLSIEGQYIQDVAYKAAARCHREMYNGVDKWPYGLSYVEILNQNRDGTKLTNSQEQELRELGFRESHKQTWYMLNPGRYQSQSMIPQIKAAEIVVEQLEDRYIAYERKIDEEQLEEIMRIEEIMNQDNHY